MDGGTLMEVFTLFTLGQHHCRRLNPPVLLRTNTGVHSTVCFANNETWFQTPTPTNPPTPPTEIVTITVCASCNIQPRDETLLLWSHKRKKKPKTKQTRNKSNKNQEIIFYRRFCFCFFFNLRLQSTLDFLLLCGCARILHVFHWDVREAYLLINITQCMIKNLHQS